MIFIYPFEVNLIALVSKFTITYYKRFASVIKSFTLFISLRTSNFYIF